MKAQNYDLLIAILILFHFKNMPFLYSIDLLILQKFCEEYLIEYWEEVDKGTCGNFLITVAQIGYFLLSGFANDDRSLWAFVHFTCQMLKTPFGNIKHKSAHPLETG